MRLEYYPTRGGNFGDDLNGWLWPKVLPPGFLDDDPTVAFIGIGTLLNQRFEANRLKLAKHRHVFGSGCGYGDPVDLDERWTVHFVRGPQSASILGLPPSKAKTDPAILIADQPLPSAKAGPRLGFMPHHSGAGLAPWPLLCRVAGLRYIDPRWSVDRVLAEMRGLDALGAEAMHGAIVADALRIPWAPVFLHEHITPGKWTDWAATLGVGLEPLTWRRPVPISGWVRGARGRLQLPLAMRRVARRLERGGVLSGDSAHRRAWEQCGEAVRHGVRRTRSRAAP